MSEPDLRELLGEDVPDDELARLQRVHDLLLAAGPAPELPESLAEPPTPESAPARVLTFPRRRVRAALLLAAAVAVAAFGFGYLAGALGGGSGFDARFAVPMHGTAAAPAALAALKVGEKDKDGNWPLMLNVRGLRPLGSDGYYELLLTKHGQVVASCGTFRVHSGTTSVRLNAPYRLKNFDGWVIMARRLGAENESNTVLLTT
jgi:hypothetical protein